MPVLLILLAAALIALAAWLLEWKPIDSWRTALRRWSTWLHGAGLANIAAYLGIWNMMPLAVQRVVPGNVLLIVGLMLWVAGALAVYVRQDALRGGDGA
jgi:hypothetical protein